MGKKSEETIRNFTHKYSKVCVGNNEIKADMFDEYGVKRGLRDKNGKGVLSGLTNISLIKSSEEVDGKSLLGLMMLAAGCGSKIKIIARGEDSQQAVAELSELVKNKFNEADGSFQSVLFLIVLNLKYKADKCE